jgi:hypothetical protein
MNAQGGKVVSSWICVIIEFLPIIRELTISMRVSIAYIVLNIKMIQILVTIDVFS